MLLGGLTSNASAMLITNISGVDIGGTSYDMTFHVGQTFNELWDSNGDGTFGNDASVFNAQPTFWGPTFDAAEAATAALIALFPDDGSAGTFALPCPGFCDGFLIPRGFSDVAGVLSAWGDIDPSAAGEFPFFTLLGAEETRLPSPWASFALSASDVPVPAPLALIGLGLAGIGWTLRKRAR